MEKARKDLKVYSIVILALTAIVLIGNIVSVCVKGLPPVTEIPEGLTKETVEIIKIISFALTFVVLIPQIFVGIKGIKVAKNPDARGKAHMVWAIILAVLSAVAVISGTIDLVKKFDVDLLLGVINNVLDVCIFIGYYLCARKIANAK